MSYYCEMCGRELDQREAKRAIVEGSLLVLCPTCYSRLSKQSAVKEVRVNAKPAFSGLKRRGTSIDVQGSSRRIRIDEYEVVEDYAIRVKKAREKLGWTQEVLAQKIGENVNTVKRIEAGKLKPSIELARKLERVLGIKLLEPVVDETGGGVSGAREEFLTIGDIISTAGEAKK